MSQQTTDPAVDATQTQSLFRDVNERVVEIDGSLPAGTDRIGLMCECAIPRCTQVITLSKEEYEGVRRFPTHFVVHPGHVVADVERVVASYPEFSVVEKFGEAGTLAVALDPRRNGDEPAA
jgi:hypothetical protein